MDEDEEEQPAKPKSLSTSGIFQVGIFLSYLLLLMFTSLKAREAKINKTKDILGVPSHIAQALLQHFQWVFFPLDYLNLIG